MTHWTREHDFDVEIAQAHGAFPAIPVEVIKAIIAIESAFTPTAYLAEVGGDGSIGLMQVRLSTAQRLGYGGTAENLAIPAINIYYGTAYLDDLSRQINASGWDPVASAYNGDIRPELGFGAPVTTPTTVCLRHDPRTGRCLETFTAQPGQYGNQPYVDKFRAALAYFAGGGTPPASGGGGMGGVGVGGLALLVGGALLWMILKARGATLW